MLCYSWLPFFLARSGYYRFPNLLLIVSDFLYTFCASSHGCRHLFPMETREPALQRYVVSLAVILQCATYQPLNFLLGIPGKSVCRWVGYEIHGNLETLSSGSIERSRGPDRFPDSHVHEFPVGDTRKLVRRWAGSQHTK